MEFYDNSGDDDGFEDEVELEFFNIVGKFFVCEINGIFIFEIIIEIDFNVVYMVMDVFFEISECVFCKRKVCDVYYVVLSFIKICL